MTLRKKTPLLIIFLLSQIVGCGETINPYDIAYDAYLKENYSVAISNFKKCTGESRCQEMLGFSYYEGAGVKKDFKEALRWYEMAATQGAVGAQYALGILNASYHEGLTQNKRKAFYWYRLAAEQGHGPAQYEVGHMYFAGVGVPSDNNQALEWYKLALDSGVAGARNRLGYIYENAGLASKFVGKPKVVAYALYSVDAMEGGFYARDTLSSLEGRMTRGEVKTGKELAAAIYGDKKVVPILDYYLKSGMVNSNADNTTLQKIQPSLTIREEQKPKFVPLEDLPDHLRTTRPINPK